VKPIAKYYGTLYLEIAEPVPSISEQSQESKGQKSKSKMTGQK